VLATLNVFFRDVRYFYEAALLAWFYATPVFYPFEILSPPVQALLRWNPMFVLIEVFRLPLYAGTAPALSVVAIGALEAALMLAAGCWVFTRYEPRFVDYV
jgi:ABC-type polysaccharide/polyol phosphate export permease